MNELIEKLHKLEPVIGKELDTVIDQGCVKPEQWGPLGEAVDIAKDIVTTTAMSQEYSETADYEYSRDSMPRVHMPRYPYSRDGQMTGDIIDSRGSRDYMDQASYSNNGDVNSAIYLLEKKLDRTSDPKARESMMETIDFLKKGR